MTSWLRKRTICIGGLALTLLTPLISFAQSAADREGFVPLVGVPFLDSSATTLPNYADALYFAAISLGAVIAVLKIIFAGVKYMLSDVVTDKSSAKADIKGALLGLIIMIGAVLLLNTINPQITSISTLRLQGVSVPIAEPTEPQTPCEIDANSPECCVSRPGGIYLETAAGPVCNTPGEEIDDDEVYDTGDELGDQTRCEQDNNVWDSVEGVCREPAEVIVPIPSGWVGIETYYCGSIDARYDDTRNVCVMNN